MTLRSRLFNKHQRKVAGIRNGLSLFFLTLVDTERDPICLSAKDFSQFSHMINENVSRLYPHSLEGTDFVLQSRDNDIALDVSAMQLQRELVMDSSPYA